MSAEGRLSRPASLVVTLVFLGCSSTPSPLTPNMLGTIGAPGHGVLLAGVELPSRGAGYRWLSESGEHYGVPRLVDAVETVAWAVEHQRPGGAPLMVGDLSKRSGGQIARHRSHRTGRDVDLLFFAETPEGNSIPSPGFVKYGADGLAFIPQESGGPRFVRLDLPREWLLIKALMTTPAANVQWLFISAPLEGLITEYARARGEDPEIIWRAENVMLQPKDSLPHDDHLHLRTACTPEEALVGCEGGGPYWPWLPPLPMTAPIESDDELILALLEPIEAAPRSSKIAPFVTLPPRDEGARGLSPRQGD
ncbi:MAG TPA: penicillin-insensitive murein endopeptidase [Polyangiaceae bacterium]|nr:penicillin-insensitive murein endopeptidase [Polyangiaceae bacterium]